MFPKATENQSYVWLKNNVDSSTEKVETAWFIFFGYSGVADHTSETSFVIAFVRVALRQPKEPH